MKSNFFPYHSMLAGGIWESQISRMNRTLGLAWLTAFTSLTSLSTAQDAPTDIEARRESVANLELHIAQREKRMADWAKDIIELDQRIETQVADLVKLIAGLRDSEDSRSKVNQLKKHAIDGLENGIKRYSSKRREVAEKVRTGDSNALGDLGKFDERILKRVDQIATLTKSIPTHQDVEKYESDGGSYWNGYYAESSRVTDEWRKNRRETSASNVQRKETTTTIQEGLEKLDRRRRDLEDSIKNRQLTPESKELYTHELGQIDAYEDHLNLQLRDVTTSTGGGGTAVGADQAQDIVRMFDDARSDLRADVSSLFQKYDQFLKGRAYLESLKQNLAARKKWLEEHKGATPAGK